MNKVNSLKRELLAMQEKNSFWRFDSFMMEQLGVEDRRSAWRIFREKTNHREIATIPTMERWFGIGGYTTPKRSHIFEMVFAMNLGVEKLNEYLMEGICEPGVRINDYQEVIFLYGLGKSLSYQECLDLIEQFEEKLEWGIEVCHSTNTLELQQQFEVKKELPWEVFLEWMGNNAGAFRGYSKTSLKYLMKFKQLVLDEVERITKEELEELLVEVGYDKWRRSPKRMLKKGHEGKYIREFMYNAKHVEAEQKQEILTLVQYAYYAQESNVRAITEVFSVVNGKKNGKRRHGLVRMTEKRMSDLLNVAKLKERDILSGIAERTLCRLERASQHECPDWICQMVEDYAGKWKGDGRSVQEMLQRVREFRKEHQRRCALVQREDLLPFVLYESQRRYWKSVDNAEEAYEAEQAKADFMVLANQTMAACNMACLSEKYALDSALLACFQQDEMYSYADVLEVVESMS